MCDVTQMTHSYVWRDWNFSPHVFTENSFELAHTPEVAVCCSVLQCVAVCRSVLQCVAVCCSVPHVFTENSFELAHTPEVYVCCSVSQCVAVYHMCLRRTRLNSHMLLNFLVRVFHLMRRWMTSTALAPWTLDLPQTSRANPVQCCSTHQKKIKKFLGAFYGSTLLL